MNTKPWSFSVNPFLAATDGSYANTQRISHFHLAALFNAQTNDVYFVPFYTTYKIKSDAYDLVYTNFLAQGNTQQGSVESVTVLLGQGTAKVNHWDALVQAVYAKGSAQYLILFPNGHTSFMQGSQESRINTFKTLSTNIGTDAALSAVKAEVDAYYVDLMDAFTHKSNNKYKTGVHSDGCDAARVDLCEQQYLNLGSFIAKFFQTPDVVAAFFDLVNIRSSSQTDFTRLVKPLSVFTIVKRTLAPTDQIRINNTGPAILRFFVGNVKDAAIGITFIEVAPGANNDYAASLLGDVTNNHFIIVYNVDAIQTGSFVLDLL
jgi:hypothetical protein